MEANHTRLIVFWRIAPFTRLLLPLLAGILAGQYLGGEVLTWQLALAGMTVIFLLALFMAFRRPVLFGVVMFGWFCALGGYLVTLNDLSHRQDFIANHYTEGSLLVATLLEEPIEKTKSWKSEAQITITDTINQIEKELSGKIILYFAKDSLQAPGVVGSRIAFTKNLQRISNTGNPAGFDYALFSARRNLFYQIYLTENDYVSAGHTEEGWLHKRMRTTRNWLLETLKQNIKDSLNRGLAAALLTGYREDMDKELSLLYAGTGVAHIIAISGLHLGLIQGGLMVLLLPLTKWKHGKPIRVILVIVLLWLFSLLTGGSASVLRAALMFSIIMFGDLLQRRGNGYNSLAASAFLLLLFNPNLLWDVGFQLSYAAVLSILVFYPPIAHWFRWPRIWMLKIWQVVAVTLSAQILTLPFVIYYFQQFPVYFLLANLVAVPLSTGILYLLLVLGFFVWWWTPVAAFLGTLSNGLIGFMNAFIGWIDRLPMSRVEDIYLPLSEAYLFMILICLFALWLFHKRSVYFTAGLATVSFLAGIRLWNNHKHYKNNTIIVYHVPGHSAVDIMAGGKYWFWGDTICQQPGMIRKLHLTPYRTQRGAALAGTISFQQDVFQQWNFGGLKMIVLDKEPDLKTADSLYTDVLLIAANVRTNPAKILSKIQCRQIVADAKLPYYRIAQWQKVADSLKLGFHSVSRDGAFVYQLNRRKL